jgi:hypothetical protein
MLPTVWCVEVLWWILWRHLKLSHCCWYFGVERCGSWNLVRTVFCGLLYCVLISAGCWSKYGANIKELSVLEHQLCGELVNVEVVLYALKYVLFCFYTLSRLYTLHCSSSYFSFKAVGPARYWINPVIGMPCHFMLSALHFYTCGVELVCL